jgi:hypothetical protein
MGCGAWFFKFLPDFKHMIWLKCFYCSVCSVAFVIASDLNNFSNSKFIACLAFGYTCFRFWGDKKPSKEMGFVFWTV